MIKGKTRYVFISVLGLMLLSGCSYKWGLKDRRLAGGYTEVSVPLFKNRSQEVSIETSFTNALVEEFSRSQVAQVVNDTQAPVKIEGVIEKVEYIPEGKREGTGDPNSELADLPEDAVLATNYRIYVTVKLTLVRVSDRKILWQGQFRDERVYAAPQLETELINSANALYNHSARQLNIKELAFSMMSEAHDRMTETF